MRALLIAPKFFGYENEIRMGLERLGYVVDFLPDRPFGSSVAKAVFRLAPELVLPLVTSHNLKAIEGFGRTQYNLIFVVKGEGISSKIIRQLRAYNPNAKFVYYTWDNIKNMPSYAVDNLLLYDDAISFDALDSKAYGLRYWPLFFLDGFDETAKKNSVPTIDLSFVGTVHSDRYKIISSIRESFLSSGAVFYVYPYLQAKWLFYAKRVIDKSFREADVADFKYSGLPKEMVQQCFKSSRAILDIEHPNQTGMTMRTFETLGAGKKLVTTNASVVETDFYSSQNVLLIDRKKEIKIPLDFLRGDVAPLPEAIRKKYNLSGWLNNVVGIA